MKLKGKVWRLGDNISTDDIIPGRFFHLRSDLPQLAKHLFEDLEPQLVKEIKKGDFIVGGKNFGLGSSREHAPSIIKLVAQSFARIFFRNCVNLGLPVIICDTSRIEKGDELEIDLDKGEVKNKTKGFIFNFPPLPPVMANILKDGGLILHIEKHGDFQLE